MDGAIVMTAAFPQGSGDAESAFLERTRRFAPRLAESAASASANGRLDPEVLRGMRDIGVFRAHTPKEFGGYQLPYAALTEVVMELGRYCGSTAWVAGVSSSGSWRLAKCKVSTQQRVWGDSPDVLVAGAFANIGAVCERTDGGWIVSGQWLFCSGIHHAEWVGLVIPTRDDGGSPLSQFGFVPRDQVTVLPTWKSIGMAATGSDNLLLDEVFVPDEMLTPYADVDSVVAPGQAAHDVAAYRLALTSVFSYSVSAPLIGTAQGALSAYLAAPPTRREDGVQEVQQATRLRAAESAAEIAAARALCRADMAFTRAAAEAGEPLTEADKCRLLRNSAFVARTCRNATTRLVESLGARGQDPNNPVQRFHADTCAGAAHGVLNWDVAGATYAARALEDPAALA
jgi:alkylation response protein AidB-like acyl-CoA dehydrogenase